jgi:HlyD family secretion protein
MKRIIAIIVVLSVGLGVTLYIQLGRLESSTQGPAGGTGVVEGIQVDVTARIPARILVLHVDEGDPVEAGQVLVELDCSEPRAALNQAKAAQATAEAGVQAAEAGVEAASLNSRAARQAVGAVQAQVESVAVGKENAVREARRVESMSQVGAISASRLDQAQTAVEHLGYQIDGLRASQQAASQQALAAKGQVGVAQAQVLAARGQVEVAKAAVMRAETVVEECTLKAPRKGVVLSRNFEPGEAVLPGSRILDLVDLHEVRVTFFLPNAELSSAASGKPVTVSADAWPDKTFRGTIRHVSAQAEFTPRNVQTREDRDRLVYGVEIAVPNPDGLLRPGMPVEVAIDGSAPEQ